MTRSLKIYQGEDELPVVDVTEPSSNVHVIWEEVEAGGRAFRGESNLGTFPMRDERGETGSELNLPSGLAHTSLSAGSRIEWLVNSTRLFRGRIGPKDYSRGRQKADRAREVVVSANDTNYDLRNIIVDGWDRPEETDVARVQALITDYLTGSPRASTTISDTYVATGSNTVTLGPKVYDATQPAEILSEIATIADKLHFVTIDDELFYDGYDSTAYQSGLSISDRIDEIDTASTCVAGSGPTVLSSGADGGSGDNDVQVTVTSGAGALYAVLLTSNNQSSPPSFTYQSDMSNPATAVSMTIIGTVLHPTPSSGSNMDGDALYIARLPNPVATSGGAGEVRVVHSESPFGIGLGYWVTDSSATPTVVTNSGTGTSSSVAATSAGASDLVLDCAGWRIWSLGDVSQTPSATAGQTQDWAMPIVSSPGQNDGAWGGGESVGPDTLTWNLVTSTNWVSAAIIIPSAESASGPTFPPIWDVGPSSTEDGMELLSGLRLYYGQGSNTYVYVNDPTTANSYWHSEQSLYTNDALIDTPAKATTLAEAILQHRKFERRTYNVSIGPLEESHVGCLKPGQLINIKARAIPDADDNYVTRRIAQLRWTTPVPGTYFAHMMLDRPMKDSPSSIGPKQATDSINRHVEQGSNSHPEYVQRGTLTTQGDLPYRGASDWTRLGIGASNTYLKSIGTVPIWSTVPGVGSAAAEDVTITDAGGYFTGTDVEAALQELGAAGTPWFLPEDYGAVGDNSTDDTTALQDCLNAIDTAGGGSMLLTANYKITAELNWDGSGLQIIGLGTRYAGAMIRQATANLGVFNFNTIVTSAQQSGQPPVIRDVVLRGPGYDDSGLNGTSTAGDGIYCLADVILQNVGIEGFYNGVNLGTDSWYSSIEGCFIYQNRNAGILGASITNLNIDRCRIGFNGYGVRVSDTTGLRLTNSSVEMSENDNVWIDGLTGSDLNTTSVLISGCYFEGNLSDATDADIRLGANFDVFNTLIQGCNFTNVHTYTSLILDNAQQTTVVACDFWQNSTGDAISSTANTGAVILVGGRYEGDVTLPSNSIRIDADAARATPQPNGTAAAGTSAYPAFADHVHEGDSSAAGHYELLMTGSSPPDPLEDGTGTDWLYVWVND